MKKWNFSKIMSEAWNSARQGAKKFGGNAKLYFACALALTWQAEKKQLAVAEPKQLTVYYRGQERFVLPGAPLPVIADQSGRLFLPGIGA